MTIAFESELIELLRQIAPVSDDMLSALEGKVVLEDFSKGEIVIKEGVPCHKIYAIREGIFRNYVDDNGSECIRWFAVRGDVFTAMVSLKGKMPAVTSVDSLTHSQAWTISINDANAMLESNAGWRDWMLKMLADGFAIREQRDAIMVSTDAYKRFKRFYNIRNIDIINQIPLKHVASYLRVTPQTLSACRRRFARENNSGNLNMTLKLPE